MTKEQLLDAIVVAAGVTPDMTMGVAYAIAEEMLFRRVGCIQRALNDHVCMALGRNGIASSDHDSQMATLRRAVTNAIQLSENVPSTELTDAIRRVQEAEWKRTGEANCASCD